MATYPATYVAYRVVTERLRGGAIWGQGVYGDVAPAWAEKPYVVVSLVSEDEAFVRKIAAPVVILQIKCVAEDFDTAARGAQAIASLLRDEGYQESRGLSTDADWHVSTVSQQTAVYLRESRENDEIYHMGHQYRLIMEAK